MIWCSRQLGRWWHNTVSMQYFGPVLLMRLVGRRMWKWGAASVMLLFLRWLTSFHSMMWVLSSLISFVRSQKRAGAPGVVAGQSADLWRQIKCCIRDAGAFHSSASAIIAKLHMSWKGDLLSIRSLIPVTIKTSRTTTRVCKGACEATISRADAAAQPFATDEGQRSAEPVLTLAQCSGLALLQGCIL